MEFYYYWIKFKLFLPLLKCLSFFYKNKIVFKTKDFIYFTNDSVDPIAKFLMQFNLFEKKERKLINNLDENLDTIEIGGGIGLVSLYIKKKIKNSKLIILEPNHKFHKLIQKNFTKNNFDLKDVIILNSAVSSEDAENVSFFEHETPFVNKIHSQSIDYGFKKINEKKINTVSLNSILNNYKLNNFQLVMDAEGEEFNILLNNNNWLKKCRSILYECHYKKEKLNEINNYLIKSGFNLIKKNENVFLLRK